MKRKHVNRHGRGRHGHRTDYLDDLLRLLPTRGLKGACWDCKVSRQTVLNERKRNPEFAMRYRLALLKQPQGTWARAIAGWDGYARWLITRTDWMLERDIARYEREQAQEAQRVKTIKPSQMPLPLDWGSATLMGEAA